MDKFSKEKRSEIMKAIKNKNSQIEIALSKALWQKGYRYRRNCKDIIGKPDIAFLKYKIAIFIDSEFWHGYDWNNKKREFKSNKDFWINKIESNMKRDELVNRELIKKGWIVLRFWGKQIKKDLTQCIEIIDKTLEERGLNIRVKKDEVNNANNNGYSDNR